MASLDEGRPFNISPEGKLFNQCGVGRPFKQLVGCTGSATNYPYRNKKGKRAQIVLPSKIMPSHSNHSSPPKSGRKKMIH